MLRPQLSRLFLVFTVLLLFAGSAFAAETFRIATYNVDRWGGDYFTINSAGNVEARPLQENGGNIDILEVVNEARSRGLGFPLVIRFQDLLRHRVESVNRAFHNAMTEFGYRNQYRGVFPIKVNQLREVIEEIVDAGQQFHFGLEAGSKPELVAALAMHKDPESLIICNGYKDPAFIRIALLGCKLGKSVVIVVEKLEELGAKVDYHDPHVPRTHKMRRHDLGMKSIKLSGAALAKYDCVLIATHHSAYDWQLVADHAKLIVDTRGVLRKVKGRREHIVSA